MNRILKHIGYSIYRLNKPYAILAVLSLLVLFWIEGGSFIVYPCQNSTGELSGKIRLLEDLDSLKRDLKIPKITGIDVSRYLERINSLEHRVIAGEISIEQAISEYDVLRVEIYHVKIEGIKRLLVYILIAEVFTIILISMVIAKI